MGTKHLELDHCKISFTVGNGLITSRDPQRNIPIIIPSNLFPKTGFHLYHKEVMSQNRWNDILFFAKNYHGIDLCTWATGFDSSDCTFSLTQSPIFGWVMWSSSSDCFYDSLPPAEKPSDFFNDCFMSARHEEGCYETQKIVILFLYLQRTIERRRRGGKGQGAPYFRRHGRVLVSKPGISVKNIFGGGYE